MNLGVYPSRNVCLICVLILAFAFYILILPLNLTYGHAFVTSSDPSSSQSIAKSPSKVNVFFSEPVDVRYSKLKVLDQNGKQIETSSLQYLGGDQSALSARLPQLKDGVYTVSTTVLSQTDGHVTDNAFVFAVGEAKVPSGVSKGNSQESTLYIPEALARFPTLVGQVIIVGCAFSTLWLWRPIYKIHGLSSLVLDMRRAVEKRLVTIFLLGSVIVIISDFSILLIQASSISASVSEVITTKFGMIVLVRTVLSLPLLILSLINFKKSRRSPSILSKWNTGGILALGISLLLTTSLIGHGAANNQYSSILLDFIHNLTASIWIGGVIYLGFILTSKLQGRSLKDDYKIAILSLMISRFSLIVVTLFGFLAFTGPYLLYTLNDNLLQILSSLYGTTLIVKLTLAAIMLSLGSYNQLSIQKRAKILATTLITVSTNSRGKDTEYHPDINFLNLLRKKDTKKADNSNDIISRFSKVTKVESIFGILLIGSVAFLVNIGVPVAETNSQGQVNPYINNLMLEQSENSFKSTYFVDNNTRIILSIVPFTVGNNNFTISFVNSHNIPLDISSATFQYNELEKSIGPIKVDVKKISKGIFSAKGAFGIPGLWNLQIEGIPDKPNSTAIASVFNNIRVKPGLEQLQFNITEFNTPSNASQPLFPLYDKSTNSIWTGDTDISSGRLLEFRINDKKFIDHPINGSSIITLLAEDGKNNIWFVDPITKQIGSYQSITGKSQLFPLPKNVVPSGLAVDLSGNLWIISSTTSEVLIFDSKTHNITKQIGLMKGARPLSIVIDSVSGLAWIADETGKLIKIDPTSNFNLTTYSPTGFNNTLKSPTGLLLNNVDSKIFISEHEGQSVSSFNIITQMFQQYPSLDPKGLPFGMAFDKFGNLWVAEHTINKIAVIDPLTGKTKEVSIPNSTPFVQWLTSDSGGNIWLAEQRGHALAMVTTKINPPTLAQPSATPVSKQTGGMNSYASYDKVMAPAIVIGLVLIAFMYVKNLVESRIAEKLLIKVRSINAGKQHKEEQ